MFPLTDTHGSTPPRLERLLEVVTDGVLALDVQGRPTYVNTAAERLLGHARHELLGQPLWTCLPELEKTELGRACQRALAQGMSATVEEYFAPLGAWLEARVFPTDEGLLVLLRDVTALEQVEAEYARLYALVMSAPAAAFVTRGPQHVFELSNPRHRQLHGGREVLGRPAREALQELEGQGLLEVLDRVYVTGAPSMLEQVSLRVEGPSGRREEHLFHLTCQPMRNAAGRVDGVATFAFEVTDLVRTRCRAEEANRAKDDFLATVSHEMRTPLTAILGWASILRSGSLPADKQARALETVERSARAQAQLVDDLLDISRIVAGRMRLERRPVELALVVDAALDAVRPTAAARDIRLEPLLESGVGPVQGDPQRLQQVACNLLTNALKFTPEGGRVTVRLRRVQAHAELEVTDSGQGIAPDFLPHVFERFRQADGSATRGNAGLGLGLAIVRHLVELHGGTVQVHSDGEGQGSRFTVRLPLAGARAEEAPESPIPAIPPSG